MCGASWNNQPHSDLSHTNSFHTQRLKLTAMKYSDGFSVGKARNHSARRESDEEDDWPAVAVAHVVLKLRRQLIGRCCRSDVVLKLNEF